METFWGGVSAQSCGTQWLGYGCLLRQDFPQEDLSPAAPSAIQAIFLQSHVPRPTLGLPGKSWGCPAAPVNFYIAPLPQPNRFLRPQIVCLPALPGAALVAPGKRCLIHFNFLFFNTLALIFFDTTLLSLSRPAVPSYGC